MANPISGILDRYRTWRYGGVTGLNYIQANATMTTIVALPWLIGYLVCFMFVPDPFLEVSIIMESIIWIFYCYGVYAYAKVDATRFRPYPQSQWRFPDGGSRKFDLKVPPDGFSKECDFEDGTQGWRVDLGQRLQYWDKRSDFPFVFDYALWRLPKTPDECFQYLSAGEFFHKGIAIKHPACEDISVYVYGWIQDEKGMYVPVCTINDCSLTYNKALIDEVIDKSPRKLSKSHKFEMAYRNERRRRMMLQRHSETLEDMVDAGMKDSRDYQKRVEDGMTKRRNLYKNIMDTEPPLIEKLKANLWKIILIVLVIVAILWFFGLLPF